MLLTSWWFLLGKKRLDKQLQRRKPVELQWCPFAPAA